MPAKDTVVSARVNPKLKKDSEKILHSLGLTTTAAIRMLFVQIKSRGGLPFTAKLDSPDEANDDLLLPIKKRRAALDSVYEG
jgi:DNA-damage-inducible protein J